ncbi:MAG: LytTR family transcriptional regulator DNA-binding domain-containing protein [Phycisphaerales bacterium JB040]
MANESDVAGWEASRGWLLRWSAAGIGITIVIALLSATQQWAELRDGPKAMSYLASVLFQAMSWASLAVLVPVLGWAIMRWPLDRSLGALLGHAAGSAVFAGVFLGVSVPVRGLFHPAPILWDAFGVPFYKSAWQWAGLALVLYWVAALAWSYLGARERLGLLEVEPAPDRPRRVVLMGLGGELLIDPERFVLARTDGRGPGGAVVVLVDGEERVREGLAELEDRLSGWGVVRVHRGCLVRADRVREVRVPGSRDGVVVLDTGDEAPVSRRRAVALRAALGLGAEPGG